MSEPGRPRIAFGCRLTPGEPATKLVWLGRLLGYSACATYGGCWHAEVACYTEGGSAIAAEVCMPSQHHLIEILKMFDELPRERREEFITKHLPEIAKQVDAKERADIRRRILG